MMARYPAYSGFENEQMKNYRFQKRPWWKYITRTILDKKEMHQALLKKNAYIATMEEAEKKENKASKNFLGASNGLYGITKPYEDINEDMPPTRTFFRIISDK